MGKHGEKEFDTDNMGLLVFGMEENWGEGGYFLIGVFRREKLILCLADY